MKNRIRLGIPTGTEARSGRYPWPEKEAQDDIIKQQLDTIGKLVNSNLMNLADELWLSNTKTIRETDEDDKIIPFPGKWHSD
jgi:hypothetical protein